MKKKVYKYQYDFHICLTGKSAIRDMLDFLIKQEKAFNPSANYTTITREAIREYYLRHGGKIDAD